MKNRKIILSILLLFLFTLFSAGYGKGGKEDMSATKDPHARESTEIWVISDLHFLSPSINDQGPSFQRIMEVGDGKNLHEIHRILDAFKEEIMRERPHALIVSGDLTNNGERESHLELAAVFSEIEEAGTEVYVTPGNHDLNNPYARGFRGEEQYRVETVTPEDTGKTGFRKLFQRMRTP